MYRLRDLKNGKYQVHVNKGEAFEGTLKAIYKKGVELGIKPDELETAVIDLARLNHDYAEFGVFGHFLYSMNDEKVA